ncbi:MAG: hypothetical protein JWR89_2834 [Tardiphaga sp.]|uniref:cysteine rich repeat-containing protein n=1 Tax=Tardiphaga sp. TaxID=1926292 RepID=UPI00260819D4|nr:cysteine rich repeat-containing protein [Tardiphaga sp.]MDB5502932.1 hypothetical protein [Tardiphaga sp.]
MGRKTTRMTALNAVLFISAIVSFSQSAAAQAPTDAQRSAIRSACRADYEVHCASVPPGGAASLQCLQKNMSSLSSACQRAVNAIEKPVEAPAAPASKTEAPAAAEPAKPAAAAPAATKSEPAATAKTTAPAPKAGSATPAGKPTDAEVAAMRQACRSDYQKTCAGVPTGGAAALSCLEKNKAKLSPACQTAVSAAAGGAAAGGAATAAGAAAPAAAPVQPLVLRAMRPREELFVARSACGGDIRTLCGGVPVGGGRIVRCLAEQAASLSPACQSVLAAFSASR